MRLADAMPDVPPIADLLPHLADLVREQGGDPTVPTRPRVLGTRRAAHELVKTQDEPPAVLDFTGIELATSSFLDELLKAWPAVTVTGMNEDVAETWALVLERRS